MREAEPGTVMAVNENDEARATGGSFDCSEVMCSNRKQLNPCSGFIGPRTYNSRIEMDSWSSYYGGFKQFP